MSEYVSRQAERDHQHDAGDDKQHADDEQYDAGQSPFVERERRHVRRTLAVVSRIHGDLGPRSWNVGRPKLSFCCVVVTLGSVGGWSRHKPVRNVVF